MSRVILVTGYQASGKTTVGSLLAQRFERAAFIEGDVLWKMVVSGREDMTAEPSDEAVRQLRLRYRHGAILASSYADAGIVAVHADNIFGEDVRVYAGVVRPRTLDVVVLAPSPAVVVERERARGSSAYRSWIERFGSLEGAVREFARYVEATPGIRIDSSGQTPDETVDEILRRLSVT